MPNRTHSSIGPQRVIPGQTRVRSALLLLLGVFLSSAPLWAQQTQTAGADTDKQTIQMLLQRIERLEERVSQLESARTPSAQPATMSLASSQAPTPGAASPVAEAEPHQEQETEHLEPERMDMSKTLLRIRGFGDIAFHGSDQPGSTNAFTLGQLNLFVTSDISEKFKFLGEIVFEGGPDDIYGVPSGETNKFSVDLERYLLQYSRNDYFNLSVGRYHTAIGFYNTAYHHSTWFQTTTGRPLMFEFEDRGVLPFITLVYRRPDESPLGALACTILPRLAMDAVPVLPSCRNRCKTKSTKTRTKPSISRCSRVRSQCRDCRWDFRLIAICFSLLGNPMSGRLSWRLTRFINSLTSSGSMRPWSFATLQTVPPRVQHARFLHPALEAVRRLSSLFPISIHQRVELGTDIPGCPFAGGPVRWLALRCQRGRRPEAAIDYTALRQQAGTNALTLQLGFTF